MSSSLQTEVNESGDATLTCSSPSGRIEGKASIAVGPGSDPRIEIVIDRSCPDEEYPGPVSV